MEADFTPTPHREAIDLIEGKRPVASEVFYGMLPELRGRAFTISGVEGAHVMQRVRDSIAGLAGVDKTWDDVKQEVVSELDPYLGDGAGQRAVVLMRTHGFQAFQASNWRVIQEDGDTTHIQYLATEDDHVRDSHLALNGLILPKDDPFWLTHFPPWEWGCRCRTRGMNPDLVEEAQQEDAKRNPDDQLVMEGPALRKLDEGTLVRDGRAYDVTAPSDERQEAGATAFQWHPDDLRMPVAELQTRYDEPVWEGFMMWARKTKVAAQETVWNWLVNPPAVKPRLDAKAKRAGGVRRAVATARKLAGR